MKKLSIAICSMLLMTACVVNEYGYLKLSMWFEIVVVLIAVLSICLILNTQNAIRKTIESLSEKGLSYNSFKYIGKYVGGHPSQEFVIKKVLVKSEAHKLCFYKDEPSLSLLSHSFDIMKDNIKEIIIQDKSTIEKRLKLGQIILVGIFALTWYKNKNKELAFIVIECNDDEGDYSTLFAFEGHKANQNANVARNHLIKLASKN